MDDVLGRVAQLAHAGRTERDDARRQLSSLWVQIGGADGDALARCAVAHALADVQDQVRDELQWDLVALSAAGSISAERLAATGAAASPAALYPSLHLNLADCYRRLGDVEQARQHVATGLRKAAALGDDGYGRMVTAALQRLAEGLQADGAGAVGG